MPDQSALSSLNHFLTVLLLKLGRRDLEEVEQVSYSGVEETVYWFSDDSDSAPRGKTLVNNVIAMNQGRIDSDLMEEYVFLHEYGHKTVSRFWTAVFYPLVLLTAAGAMFSALALISTPLLMLQYSTVAAVLSVLYFFPLAAVFTACFGLVFWADEGYAEIYALKKMGEEKARKVVEEREEDRGVLGHAWHRLRYPPIKLVKGYIDLTDGY
ncbi:MAG: hypothetical protein ABEJ75_03480 [Candidatus Nanohaloarchaea archaeon]